MGQKRDKCSEKDYEKNLKKKNHGYRLRGWEKKKSEGKNWRFYKAVTNGIKDAGERANDF